MSPPLSLSSLTRFGYAALLLVAVLALAVADASALGWFCAVALTTAWSYRMQPVSHIPRPPHAPRRSRAPEPACGCQAFLPR